MACAKLVTLHFWVTVCHTQMADTGYPRTPKVNTNVICYIIIPDRMPLLCCLCINMALRSEVRVFVTLPTCLSVGLWVYLCVQVWMCASVDLCTTHTCKFMPRCLQVFACLQAHGHSKQSMNYTSIFLSFMSTSGFLWPSSVSGFRAWISDSCIYTIEYM